jgi:nucleotide-binding universal stress UspA family protein
MIMKASAVVVPILPAIELKKILYATDFSDASLAALPLVSTIARKYGSRVFVVNVSTAISYAMVSPEAAVVMHQKDEIAARSKVLDLTKKGSLAGLSITAVVRSGLPTEELMRVVREQKIDLAILGTHGRTGLKHLVMGSVAEELFRNLPCPVLTVGPHVSRASLEATSIKHILFPTDLSDESRAVFPYLASLASEYKASLTLLHVLPIETATNPDAKSMAEPLRHEMQNTFSPHIDPRFPAEFIIDFGDTAERILAHAETGRADLIGLGVRKVGEITTHFRNTVAYRVVLQAQCPVLTARHSNTTRQFI